jgi:hypothetical protein
MIDPTADRQFAPGHRRRRRCRRNHRCVGGDGCRPMTATTIPGHRPTDRRRPPPPCPRRRRSPPRRLRPRGRVLQRRRRPGHTLRRAQRRPVTGWSRLACAGCDGGRHITAVDGSRSPRSTMSPSVKRHQPGGSPARRHHVDVDHHGERHGRHGCVGHVGHDRHHQHDGGHSGQSGGTGATGSRRHRTINVARRLHPPCDPGGA